MSTKTNCSLKDTTILRNLILENPELPLLIFVGEDSWNGDSEYTQTWTNDGKVENLILYNEEIWLDEEGYEQKLTDTLCDEEEYKNMSCEEFEKAVDVIVSEAEFVKAIAIYCN